MGIHGLTSYVNDHIVGKSFKREIIPDGSTLLIDFNSFVHHVYEGLPKSSSLPQYLGNYDAIAQAFAEVFTCFNQHDLKVVAYLDGSRSSKHKASVLKSRRKRRAEQAKTLESFHSPRVAFAVTTFLEPPPPTQEADSVTTSDAQRDDGDDGENESSEEAEPEGVSRISPFPRLTAPMDIDDDVPVPPLLFECALWCLEKHVPACEVKQAAGEADGDIIYDACRFAGSDEDGNGVFVLSADSDFFVASRCYFMPLSFFVASLDSGVSGVVFERTAFATSLGLTEESLLVFAALCGNDYTRRYTAVREKIVCRKNMRVRDVLAWLITAQRKGGVDLSRSCDDKSFLEAVKFSNELYDGLVQPRDSDVENRRRLRSGRAKEEKDQEKILLLPHARYVLQGEAKDSSLRKFSRVAADITILKQARFVDRYREAWLEHMVLDAMSRLADTGFVSTEGLKRAQLCCGVLNSEDFSPDFSLVGTAKLLQSALCFQTVMAQLVKLTGCSKFPGCLYDPYTFFRLQRGVPSKPELETTCEDEPKLQRWLNGKISDGLPIEAYKDDIIQTIERHQVVMVTGETGCGKSSYLPQLLHEQSEGRARMFITQPRRLAATNLAGRLKTKMGDLIGLRLGGGIREESSKTRIWFCTAGYLMTLILSREEPLNLFDKHSHLVLDEVHERDIDMDMLLSFAKRLIRLNKEIKIVLMSATLRKEKLEDYFNLPVGFVYVGAKCFPLKEVYLDSRQLREKVLPPQQKIVDTLVNTMEAGVVSQWMGKAEQVDIAVSLVRQLAREVVANRNKKVSFGGGAILVFVAGMDQMTMLCDRFETLYDKTHDPCYYECVIVHSQVSLEEQQQAFKTIEDINTIKVVIATNAGESSLTFPDVDTVICLGSRKVLQYDAKNKSHVLSNRLISRASAIQRAGRAARTRPGTVYRLYTYNVYGSMDEYDLPEVLTAPLTNLVLNLKSFATNEQGGVLPLLEELMDPPKQEHVVTAMDRLRELDMLQGETDKGSRLTVCGNFATTLPLDVQLSRMLFLGVVFGVAELIIPIAAVLNNPQPFRIASPLVLDADDYTDVVNRIVLAKLKLDGGLYSEPLMHVRLLSVWLHATKGFQREYCKKNGLSYARMTAIVRDYDYLRQILRSRWGIIVQHIPPPDEVLRCPKAINRVRLLLYFLAPKMLLCKKPARYPPCKLQRVTIEDDKPVPSVIFQMTSIADVVNETFESAFPECCDWCVRDDFVARHVAIVNDDSIEWTRRSIHRYVADPLARSLLESKAAVCDAVYVMRKSLVSGAVQEYILVPVATAQCLLESTLRDKLKSRKMVGTNVQFEYQGTQANISAVFHNYVELHVDYSREQVSVKLTCHNVECSAEDLELAEFQGTFDASAEWHSERTALGQSLHAFYVDGPTPSSIFADMPITARLTLAYCRGYRPRNRFVVVDPETGRQTAVEFDADCYRSRFGTWRTFHRKRLAYLESHSLANLAYNCSDNMPLLAILSRFVEVETGGKEAPIQCTGITILPRGQHWYTLAKSLSHTSSPLVKLVKKALHGSARDVKESVEAVSNIDEIFAQYRDVPRALPEDMYQADNDPIENDALLALVPSAVLRRPHK